MNILLTIQQLLRPAERTNKRAALVELCERGLITCTRGNPGDDDATYALAWMPLDNPEEYSADVRARHSANMASLRGEA